MGRTVLMSIKPRFARRIFDGSKRWELRRQPTTIKAGDTIVIYESAPRMAITGHAKVFDVYRATVPVVRVALSQLGVSKAEYDAYFEGSHWATAIGLTDVTPRRPIGLEEMRDKLPGFRPPQSYMFIDDRIPFITEFVAARRVLLDL